MLLRWSRSGRNLGLVSKPSCDDTPGMFDLTLTSAFTDRQFHHAPDPEKKAGRRSTRVAASIASDDDDSASTRKASEEAPVLKSVNGPERPSPMEHELPQPVQLLPRPHERTSETHYEGFLSLPRTSDVDVAESKSSVSSASEGSCSSSPRANTGA